MNNKVFLLWRDDWGYDEYDSMVVIAETKKQAREIANKDVGAEGQIWTNPDFVFCEEVSIHNAAGRVLIASFNAG